MSDSYVSEIAISFVFEQREVAAALTQEFHKLGIAVFNDSFEQMNPRRHLAIEEMLDGFQRADAIVICASDEYFDRAWAEEERSSVISEFSDCNPHSVFCIGCDTSTDLDAIGSFIEINEEDSNWSNEIAELIVGNIALTRDVDLTDGIHSPPTLTAFRGEAHWVNCDQGKKIVLGREQFKFEILWSGCNANSISVYNDPPSILGVSLAQGYTSIDQIRHARLLEFDERVQTPQKNEIVVLRNTSDNYSAILIQDVKLNGSKDDVAELRFSYVIQPDGSDDFAGRVQVESLRIRGFRSLRDVQLSPMRSLVALIGPNGSGKTNIFRLFAMLRSMLSARRLANYVGQCGGGDDQLFQGSKETELIDVELSLRIGPENLYDYRFILQIAEDDRLIFTHESYRYRDGKKNEPGWISISSSSGQDEAGLVYCASQATPSNFASRIASNIVESVGEIDVYQFHDMSWNSRFTQMCEIENRYKLERDGGNLAAILFRLEREDRRIYELICYQIGRILPGFDRFDLQENDGKVALKWISNSSRKSYGAHLTSGGSLRLFALITLLNLPAHMLPTILLLDEPELGLHPYGVNLVGGMIKALSASRQVMVATQSPLLINAFKLDEVVVLETDPKGTKVRELSSEDYQDWLEEGFQPGELWQRNLLGGLP